MYSTSELQLGASSTLQCWDLRATERPAYNVNHTLQDYAALGCASHPRRSEIVASVCGNHLNIWDLRRYSHPIIEEFSQSTSDILQCVDFNCDGTQVVTGGTDTVTLWELQENNLGSVLTPGRRAITYCAAEVQQVC